LLGVTEAGVPLAWRNPYRIWTLGPRYRLREGGIVFDPILPRGGHLVTPTFRTLTEFVKLADPATTDEDILEYARRWGMLGLCPHGLPRTHDARRVPYSLGLGLWLADDYTCGSGIDSPERVSWWRFWAGQAWALVAVMANLRAERSANEDGWEVLLTPGPWITTKIASEVSDVVLEDRADLGARVTDNVAAQRDHCAAVLEAWLRMARVQPQVRWWIDGPRLEVRNSGLFDSLGLLLTFLGGDRHGIAFCHACRAPLIPTKRLGRRDRAHYCQSCRDEGRPRRDASRAYYRRKAADPTFLESEAARQRRRRDV
jgi:hypothetical protein